MTFLLMVFLTMVCLFEAYPAAPWGGPPWLPAALTAGSLLVLAGNAAYLSRRTRRRLDADPASIDRHLNDYDRTRGWHGALLLTLFLVCLFLFGWGRFVRGEPGQTTGLGTELMLLAPFLLGQAVSFFFFYDADRAAHVASHRLIGGSPFTPGLDAGSVPVPSFGGRWSYVGFQLRQKLALVLIPVLLLVVRQEATRLVPAWIARWHGMAYVMAFAGVVTVFVGLPLLIRFVLGLRPMRQGPLRERLEATAKRLRLPVNDLLVWDTRHGMANAMIIGVLPWLRYVVFTDRMLEEFTPEEIQGVFGHELGHVKHQHMLFYLVFLVVSMSVLTLVTDKYVFTGLKQAGKSLAAQYPDQLPADLADWVGGESSLAIFPVVGLVVGYIFVVFGFLSRRCERQADVYGCRAVSCGARECAGHGPETVYSPDGTLCATGIRSFARALQRVAQVNGIDPDRPGFFQSWQHSTIGRRAGFLRLMTTDPEVEPAFQGWLAGTKWTLMAGLTAALVALVAQHGWE
ncbi:MAG: M48 family metallopeptidase [Gemmataceae bacterium]